MISGLTPEWMMIAAGALGVLTLGLMGSVGWVAAWALFRVDWRRLPWLLWAITLGVLFWVVWDVGQGGILCDW